MKNIAVSAWPPRKSGVISASPIKPPSGSTSSLIMVAISAALTRRKRDIGKRRMVSQGEQVLQARKLEAEEAGGGVGLRELVALDRLVDDRLRQVERQVIDHHGAD